MGYTCFSSVLMRIFKRVVNLQSVIFILKALSKIVADRIIIYHYYFSDIMKTRLYNRNCDPLKPHFYIVKLGFTGVYINFLISAQIHRLWVLVRTASPRRF